jgi:hypothetical protein
METDKIVSLPEYREQKAHGKKQLNKQAVSTPSSESLIAINPETEEKPHNYTEEVLSNTQAYTKAKQKLVDYFKKEIFNTPEFKKSFGDLKWKDISEKVTESVELYREKDTEKEKFADRVYAFSGRIFGLFTEIVIERKSGRLRRAFIEIT